MASAAIWHQPHLAGSAGLKPNGCARSSIKPHPPRKFPIDSQSGVCLRKVIVAAKMHGRVAGICHHQGNSGKTVAQDDVAIFRKNFAGDDDAPNLQGGEW